MSVFIEDVYDQFKEFTEDKLKSYLEAEQTNTVPLPMFQVIYRGDVDLTTLQFYPVLCMRYGGIDIIDDDTSTHQDNWLFKISLWGISKGADSEVLQRTSERYTTCIKNMIDQTNLNDYNILKNAIMKVTKIEFSPALVTSDLIEHRFYLDLIIDILLNRKE
ncbi:hypothetical protein DRQ25_08940 [Candidatus Fermentibacteria bacterium]|nr:MAG: hypothetical protein DRQ25_08940 [Candidatus Fermentibacteria bacterium]